MKFTYTTFAGVTLPTLLPEDETGTGDARISYVDSASGGGFDLLGEQEAKPGAVKLRFNRRYFHKTESTLITYLEGLRALHGRKGVLVRKWDDGSEEWVIARLQQLSTRRTYANRNHFDITFSFVIMSGWWRHDLVGSWRLDSGVMLDDGEVLDGTDTTILDTSPKDITITNQGNATITDPVFSIEAGSVAISKVVIRSEDWEIEYEATIAVGKILYIDCGAYTVLNDDTYDPGSLELGNRHAIIEWARLYPGNNEVEVILTGGGIDSIFGISFYSGSK